MDQLWQLLALPAVQRSGLALVVGAFSLPVVGVFIIGLDILPMRFAMMHVALLGVALAMILHIDPVACTLVTCAVSGAALAPLGTKPAGLSGAAGLMMPFAIALALLVLSVSGVNANGAFELLWGSILATQTRDIWILVVLAVIVQVVFWRNCRQLALLLYDRELALCAGVRTTALTLALLVLVAVAMGAGLRLTGALLIDALTILPALTARNIGTSLRSMVVYAVVIGLVGNLAGFGLALLVNQPPGPVLVLTSGLITLASFMPLRSRLTAADPEVEVQVH